MKIKYAIIYAALAVAFVAVSLWVALSGGKNAKAVRTKFRLGGLMLTVAGMLSVSSCGLFTPTCYDPVEPTCYDAVVPECVVFPSDSQTEIKVGDVIEFRIDEVKYQSYSYTITTVEGKELQSRSLLLTDGVGKITVAETDYRGTVDLVIFGINEGDGEKCPLGGRSFVLK